MEAALRQPGATLPQKVAQLLAGGELPAAAALAAASGDVRLATVIPQVRRPTSFGFFPNMLHSQHSPGSVIASF